jgi:hypothetical protein
MASNPGFDTNVSNYTLSELLDIVGITDEDINTESITDITNELIKKYKTKKPELALLLYGLCHPRLMSLALVLKS